MEQIEEYKTNNTQTTPSQEADSDQANSLERANSLIDLTVFRNDPRIKQSFREFGFLEVWQERGFPELCRPLGDDDWECD